MYARLSMKSKYMITILLTCWGCPRIPYKYPDRNQRSLIQSNDFCKNIIYDFLVRYSKEVHVIPNHWDYTYRKLYGVHMTSLYCHSWNWCDMYVATIEIICLCSCFRTSLISLRDLQFLNSLWSSSQNISPLWPFSAIANGSRNATFLPALSACRCTIL